MYRVLIFTVFSFSILVPVWVFCETREYHLIIEQKQVFVGNQSASGMTINGGIPGPVLRFDEGDLALIHVTNKMSVASSIHWHGLLVPPAMDGVPMITQLPIAPGETFIYKIPIRQSGTYWYHSHTGLQEQRGLYGSIVIDDSKIKSNHDQVLLLSDWTTDNPQSVLRDLKRGSEWFSLQKGSAQSIFGAVKAGRLADYFMRELMRMPPMDIADVAYDYFLTNGTPQYLIHAEKGEKVRLRVINGSATSYFHLNYAGGPMTVISADGQLVEPVEKDLFLIGVAETYDVLVAVPEKGTYEFRATAHDGSGFTSTWIGAGNKYYAQDIPQPALYESMEHGKMGSLFALTPAGTMGMTDDRVHAGDFDLPGLGHDMHQVSGKSSHGQVQKDDIKGHMMKPSLNFHGSMDSAGKKKDKMTAHKMDMGSSASTMMQGQSMKGSPDVESPKKQAGNNMLEGARPFTYRYGLLETDIASRVNRASEGSSERPLTPYKNLKSLQKTTYPHNTPVREIRLTLDGDMKRYTWFLNNKPLSESDRIQIKKNEIVRFIMINRTMMHHPMHLHGHFFRVMNGQGDYSPLKHTVDVAPMETTVFEFYSDEIGDWFFHCHLLYHMKSGMARVVHYQDFQPHKQVNAIRRQLYNDSFYAYGEAELLSNMSEGMLTLANSRYSLDAFWEVGWQDVDETQWEGQFIVSRYSNRFFSYFLGLDFLKGDLDEEYTHGVGGLRYLLPLNIDSTVWIDTVGGARFMLEKELELTPRIGVHGEVEYDTHEYWEGKVVASYLLVKDISLLMNYHSEFGLGVGLQVGF